MAYLIDTSVLARLANTADAQYATADRAVMVLHQLRMAAFWRGVVVADPATV
jgi:predicted nucleic acid-binding protein